MERVASRGMSEIVHLQGPLGWAYRKKNRTGGDQGPFLWELGAGRGNIHTFRATDIVLR